MRDSAAHSRHDKPRQTKKHDRQESSRGRSRSSRRSTHQVHTCLRTLAPRISRGPRHRQAAGFTIKRQEPAIARTGNMSTLDAGLGYLETPSECEGVPSSHDLRPRIPQNEVMDYPREHFIIREYEGSSLADPVPTRELSTCGLRCRPRHPSRTASSVLPLPQFRPVCVADPEVDRTGSKASASGRSRWHPPHFWKMQQVPRLIPLGSRQAGHLVSAHHR